MSDVKPLAVYSAITKVQKALAKVGLEKGDKNSAQGWKFRGIDALYNTLSKLLTEANLIILPTVLKREMMEKKTAREQPLFYVVLTVQYEFISSLDGSSHKVVAMGEAMDTSDKATNKAYTAAYKYLCFQTFCIPTEGDNDADASTPEPVMAEPVPDFSWVTEMMGAARNEEEYQEVFATAWKVFGKTKFNPQLIKLREATKLRLGL